ERGVHMKIAQPDGRELRLDDEIITLGRNDQNMVVLDNPHISGLHGRLIFKNGGYVYEDLGSTNGSMVRTSKGQDIVVDPRKTPEIELHQGDQLLLGDIASPVRIDIVSLAAASSEHETPTNIARRSMRNIDALGTALVSNPLTSRKVLHAMFGLFRTLAHQRKRSDALALVLDFALNHLREAMIAGFYRFEDEEGPKLSHEAFIARGAAWSPAVPPGSMIRLLFPDAFGEAQASVLVSSSSLLARAFGQGSPPLRSAIGAPFLNQRRVQGVLFVVSAHDFSPFDLDLLTVLAHHGSISLENIALIQDLQAAQAKLQTENIYLKEQIHKEQLSVEIIGESAALSRSLKQADAVARTDTTVLLLGETGTGKELFARYLHETGPRRTQLFAAVNCGALAETLLESELFGHRKGAFTGAHSDRKGLFQVADGGTLFLDEVGDVSPGLQVKLLRALESGEVTPVGSVRPVSVDVRIVAATNKDLHKEVQEGRFREDLFYRINVFPLHLPPLRERTGDIELLIAHFIALFNTKLNKTITGVEPVAMERLRAYHWPGNIRELQNEIERAVLLSDDGGAITPESLSERVSGMVELPVEIGPLKETMYRLEEQYILRALKQHNDNRTHTARTLGISRQALTTKLNKYGIIGNS
ncbi:MAG: sigma 54-interacting transcriptional regulator, partial [Myxococcota bacterium]